VEDEEEVVSLLFLSLHFIFMQRDDTLWIHHHPHEKGQRSFLGSAERGFKFTAIIHYCIAILYR
jgi:hypothetical protein